MQLLQLCYVVRITLHFEISLIQQKIVSNFVKKKIKTFLIAEPFSKYSAPSAPRPTYQTPRPTYQAPRTTRRPTYSAPRTTRRPTYSAPRTTPRPTYSAPRPAPRRSYNADSLRSAFGF